MDRPAGVYTEAEERRPLAQSYATELATVESAARKDRQTTPEVYRETRTVEEQRPGQTYVAEQIIEGRKGDRRPGQGYGAETGDQPLAGGAFHPQYVPRVGDSLSPVAGGPRYPAEHRIPIVGGHPTGPQHVTTLANSHPHGQHIPVVGGHVGGHDHHVPIGIVGGSPAYNGDHRGYAPSAPSDNRSPNYNMASSQYGPGPYSNGHPHQGGHSTILYPNGHHGLQHGEPHGHHNGYPGTAGVVSSAPAHHVHHDVHGTDASHVGILSAILLLCSLVLVVAASLDCDRRGNPWNFRDDDDEWRYQGCVGTNVAYAVALGTISFILVCVYIIQLRACASTRANRGCVAMRKVGVTILMILWLIGAFLCTFDGPYYFTGNGYYALWIGCFATVIAFGRFVLWKGLHDTYNAAGFDDGM